MITIYITNDSTKIFTLRNFRNYKFIPIQFRLLSRDKTFNENAFLSLYVRQLSTTYFQHMFSGFCLPADD